MIRESLYLVYDGIRSDEMGVVKINTEGGLLDEVFLPNKTVTEEKIRNKDIRYLNGVEREPIVIPISLWFEDGLSEEKIREIALWLDQDYYKELYFSEQPHRIFYAMYEGSSSLLHNGIKEGYVNLQMRCNSPYSYSPIRTSQIYDFSENGNFERIKIMNYGDLKCFPVLYIEKIEDGDISIINRSDGDREFLLTDLNNGENLIIDCENEEIETDIENTYRYDNHNDIFLELTRGLNILEIRGKCKLQFKYQFITKG